MKIEIREDRSRFSHILQTGIRPFKPHLVSPKKTFPAGSPRLKPDNRIANAVRVVERKHQEIWLYDLVGQVEHVSATHGGDESGERLRMYYFAGGGWQSPPSGQHWKFCAELVQNISGLTVSIVSAPLAPNSPAAKTVPALRKLYTSVLEQASRDGEQVIFAGDSSGGNIALSLVLDMLMRDPSKSNGLGPNALLVISPAVDLRPMEKQGVVEEVSRKDPVLTIDSHNNEARTWVQDTDPASPCISPLLTNVSLLARAGVKVIGVTGGHDILIPSALEFQEGLQRHSVEGAWLHWEKQMHCFPLAFMYRLPEAVQAKDWIVGQINKLCRNSAALCARKSV